MRGLCLLALAISAMSCGPSDESTGACADEELRCPEGAELGRWLDSGEPYCKYTCTVSCDGIDYNTLPTTLVVDAGEAGAEERDVCRYSFGEHAGYYQAYPTCVLPEESPYPAPYVVEGPDFRAHTVEPSCAR